MLRAHDVGPSVEIVSTADIPSGTGLGSSGSFTVGLLKAVHAMQRNHVSASDLGREACEIEIERLGRTVGKQDQYIAAFGGITRFDFNPDGSVDVAPARLSNDTTHDLEQHLLMFFTGYSRAADEVLAEQVTKSQGGDSAMIDNLHFVKDLGLRSLAALERRRRAGLRRPDARALAEQEEAVELDVQRAHRPRLRRGPATPARAAASWSAPGPAAS